MDRGASGQLYSRVARFDCSRGFSTYGCMKYLFAFGDIAICRSVRRALEAADIVCEVRNAHKFHPEWMAAVLSPLSE
jgi:hypothetical protein